MAPVPRYLLAALAAFALLFAGAVEASAQGDHGKHKRTFDRAWNHGVSKKNKRWAKHVSACESGGNPNAIGAGGLYRGAFQFSRPTWKTSPRSPGGDPIDYSYKTQGFVAVRLKMKVGTGPWPNCG
jgi:hypothetical protein